MGIFASWSTMMRPLIMSLVSVLTVTWVMFFSFAMMAPLKTYQYTPLANH